MQPTLGDISHSHTTNHRPNINIIFAYIMLAGLGAVAVLLCLQALIELHQIFADETIKREALENTKKSNKIQV